MRSKYRRWIKYLAAVILGNILYIRLSPWLPPGARHRRLIDWGTFVDLWFCVATYGVIELASTIIVRNRRRE